MGVEFWLAGVEHAAHHDNLLDAADDVRCHPCCQRQIGQRADGDNGYLTGIGTDSVDDEFSRIDPFQRTKRLRFTILSLPLLKPVTILQQRPLCPIPNRNIPPARDNAAVGACCT